MWGGATRVPEPEELEGLTGIKFPLNSAPMGATPLGFLMRRNKKGRGRDGLFPINTYHHLHTSPIYSPLYHAYLWQHFCRYWGSWDHHQIRPLRPSTQQDRILRSLPFHQGHCGTDESRRCGARRSGGMLPQRRLVWLRGSRPSCADHPDLAASEEVGVEETPQHGDL